MATSLPSNISEMLRHRDCAGPVNDALIQEVELSMQMKFPQEYRAFLEQFGAALLEGGQIYGLVEAKDPGSDSPPYWADLRGFMRHEVKESIANALLPISDDGRDYRFYLRLGTTSPVVVRGPGADDVQVAPTF